MAALLFVLLAWAGPPLAAQGLLQAELPPGYWMAARWQEAKTGGPDEVVIDWGISSADLEGWEAESGLPYRRTADDERIWYEMEGEELALWDIETYVQNGLRWYAAVWRRSSRASYLVDGYASYSELLAMPPASNAELVDFECYENNGSVEYLGLWRESDATLVIESETTLEFQQLSFAGLKELYASEASPPRIVDLEQCNLHLGSGLGSTELEASELESSERFLVLLEPDAGSPDLVVGKGDWVSTNGLHTSYHDEPVQVVELESVPTGKDARGIVSKWEYIWVWEPVDVTALGEACSQSGQQATDWLMVTNVWRWLEQEVTCRQAANDGDSMEGMEACGEKCHTSLQLLDLIIGTEGLLEAGYDSPQHRPTHGDGAGGPKL